MKQLLDRKDTDVQIRELAVPGAYEITPRQFADPRGLFLEWFKVPDFTETTNRRFDLKQANLSVSAAGVIRGIHFALVPPSQAKYVTCPYGAVLDFAIDIRVGSPTFGQVDQVLLDDTDRRAIFLSEGLGHAFISLQDGSVVTYLCSEGFNPDREFGINPMDEQLAVQWPTENRAGEPLSIILSDKDKAAPSLQEAQDQGLLPTWDECQAFASSLTPQE